MFRVLWKSNVFVNMLFLSRANPYLLGPLALWQEWSYVESIALLYFMNTSMYSVDWFHWLWNWNMYKCCNWFEQSVQNSNFHCSKTQQKFFPLFHVLRLTISSTSRTRLPKMQHRQRSQALAPHMPVGPWVWWELRLIHRNVQELAGILNPSL